VSAAREPQEDQHEPWRLLEEQFYLGHTYDPRIVSALRKLDPNMAPLWVLKTYKVPGFQEPQTFGRHIIARYIESPRVRQKVVDFKASCIETVIMPVVMPKELEGLPSGPYKVCELLEGKSPDGVQPGCYLPMDDTLIKRLEIGQYVQRNHSMNDQMRNLLQHFRDKRRARQTAWNNRFRDVYLGEREARLSARGELGRVPSSGGLRVGMSEQLMRLRKIAAEGVTP
jgi:hypothetical protein